MFILLILHWAKLNTIHKTKSSLTLSLSLSHSRNSLCRHFFWKEGRKTVGKLDPNVHVPQIYFELTHFRQIFQHLNRIKPDRRQWQRKRWWRDGVSSLNFILTVYRFIWLTVMSWNWHRHHHRDAATFWLWRYSVQNTSLRSLAVD